MKQQLSLEHFLEELRDTAYFQPDGNPDPEWLLVLGKTWTAARIAVADAAKAAAKAAVANAGTESAWDAARTSAWNLARIAASDAGRNELWETAWDKARDASREFVWAAARTEAPDAAWAVPWDAAWHIADYAVICVVCGDLPVPEHHRHTIEKRMEVWRKGYALMAEVNGMLYVYAANVR
ncbi:MAG TPA: hypothetical protein VKY31_12540 [Terriglobia bacterium]|nr:hypothetical protein [Terriglobia bacterium]